MHGLFFTSMIINAVQSCNKDLEKLYSLYGIISSEIHGQPWSGPSVQIVNNGLIEVDICVIKKLAESVTFSVDIINSEK